MCGGGGRFVPITNFMIEYQGSPMVKIKMILKCLIQLEIGKKNSREMLVLLIAAVMLPFLHSSTLFIPLTLIIPKENL